jgi:hypothetical protein
MRLRSFFLACAGAMVSLAISALAGAQEMQAQSEPVADNGAVQHCGKMMDCCCCDQSAYFFSLEATVFKFHDAGGVEDANGIDGKFDFELMPRITLGYVGCDGLGARIRYWDFDADTKSKAHLPISVETYNVDFEVFQVCELDCCTALEFSAGIRYNDFEHHRTGLADVGPPVVLFVDKYDFSDIGGMIGIEARRDLGNGLGVYARLREVILMGDTGILDNNDEIDVTRPVTEIAFGADYCYCGWTVHGGLEWQNWGNYTTRALDGVDDDVEFVEDVNDNDDIGFAGFVFGVSTSY